MSTSDHSKLGQTRTSRFINVSAEVLYQAFTEPEALVQWLPPGDMTGQMYEFDLREGGGYRMSLFYPEGELSRKGKTADREDAVNVRFDELAPPKRLVEAVTFNSDDPAFAGEMTLIATFDPEENGTNVTIECKNIPAGIRSEDNERGSRESLEQLATYVAEPQPR